MTGDAVISNVFPLRHLFSVGTRLWCLRQGFTPKKDGGKLVKLVFLEGFKDDLDSAIVVGQAIQVGPPVVHQWATGGMPVVGGYSS